MIRQRIDLLNKLSGQTKCRIIASAFLTLSLIMATLAFSSVYLKLTISEQSYSVYEGTLKRCSVHRHRESGRTSIFLTKVVLEGTPNKTFVYRSVGSDKDFILNKCIIGSMITIYSSYDYFHDRNSLVGFETSQHGVVVDKTISLKKDKSGVIPAAIFGVFMLLGIYYSVLIFTGKINCLKSFQRTRTRI